MLVQHILQLHRLKLWGWVHSLQQFPSVWYTPTMWAPEFPANDKLRILSIVMLTKLKGTRLGKVALYTGWKKKAHLNILVHL